MELFEQIRREYDSGVGTIQGVARQFGVHRRLVREALGSAIPAELHTQGRGRRKSVGALSGIPATRHRKATCSGAP